MKPCLLDTNVISELMTNSPNRNVVNFLSDLNDSHLSVITFHELQYGLNLLPEGQRKNALTANLQNLLVEYGDCIIPVTNDIATHAALLRSDAKLQGRVVHLADALIAGTAKLHNLVIATRNVKDFVSLGVDLVNPWGKD